MEAYSAYTLPHLISHIDFSQAHLLLDVGGGAGGNAIALALRCPNLSISILDLSEARMVAEENIGQHKLHDRVSFIEHNVFLDEFPHDVDMVALIHMCVIWSEKQNRTIFEKAYRALVPGGRVIIFSSIADDDEHGPLMTALDTVYFNAVAAGNGMVYPFKDYEQWLTDVGFRRIERFRCNTWTPHGIVVGYKE